MVTSETDDDVRDESEWHHVTSGDTLDTPSPDKGSESDHDIQDDSITEHDISDPDLEAQLDLDQDDEEQIAWNEWSNQASIPFACNYLLFN